MNENENQHKIEYYVSSIQNAFFNEDLETVKKLWTSLMQEKVISKCGLEPNADVILEVRKQVFGIVSETMKSLGI
tara:strand:+ start:120 stop:344 length:225 start_codon:yes stop_codon:yes gene_type:complete